jgi:hypothetical protein
MPLRDMTSPVDDGDGGGGDDDDEANQQVCSFSNPCHIAKLCSLGSLHVLCTVASDGIRPSCTSGTFGVMCTLRNTWRLPKERSIAVRHEV